MASHSYMLSWNWLYVTFLSYNIVLTGFCFILIKSTLGQEYPCEFTSSNVNVITPSSKYYLFSYFQYHLVSFQRCFYRVDFLMSLRGRFNFLYLFAEKSNIILWKVFFCGMLGWPSYMMMFLRLVTMICYFSNQLRYTNSWWTLNIPRYCFSFTEVNQHTINKPGNIKQEITKRPV